MNKIVVLPGLGATGAMYQGPWREDSRYLFLDWPKGSGITTLDGLCDWVCEQEPEVTVYAGSSLGGMIALLCATKRKHGQVVLLGSATCYDEVSPIFQRLQPISKLLPFELTKFLAGSIPMQLSQMYAEQDAQLMKNLLLDLPNFSWADDGVKVIRIHGEHDAVINCPADADLKLDGGHLIAISHAKEICEWLSHLFDHGLFGATRRPP